MVLLGIEPKSLDTGLEMSDEVGRNLGVLADNVAIELASLGLDILRKTGTTEELGSPCKTEYLPTAISPPSGRLKTIATAADQHQQCVGGPYLE